MKEWAGERLCFEQQTGAWVRRRGTRLEVYMCSLPLNQGTGWINNTIDIPVMRSWRAIHNYFIVAVMRALALPMHCALAGRPLQKTRAQRQEVDLCCCYTQSTGWTLLPLFSLNICCMNIELKEMTGDLIIHKYAAVLSCSILSKFTWSVLEKSF